VKRKPLWGGLTVGALVIILLLGRVGGGTGRAQDGDPTGTPTPFPVGSDNAAREPVIHEVDGIPFVVVPAGCFMMGSADGRENEAPVHRVCVSAFWIGQTEVTNTQYAACVEAGACDPPWNPMHLTDPAYADHPVVYIDWERARTYATWIGCDLPTEAQWEYAARGPASWVYPWGDDPPECAQANVYGCAGEVLPVGPDQRPDGASWVGALDMAGNVWEWTADRFQPGYYAGLADGALDPTGPTTGDRRVLRGGSHYNDAFGVRSAYRNTIGPILYDNYVGFRVACPEERPE
jgi:formylglycine-generating enzyme required for sulfatase activity